MHDTATLLHKSSHHIGWLLGSHQGRAGKGEKPFRKAILSVCGALPRHPRSKAMKTIALNTATYSPSSSPRSTSPDPPGGIGTNLGS